MLPATSLGFKIAYFLSLVNKWNGIPVSYPYKIFPPTQCIIQVNLAAHSRKHCQILVNESFVSFSWKIYLLTVLLASLLIALHTLPYFNLSTTTFETSVRIFVSILYLLVSLSICFHQKHAKQIIILINQLFRLESDLRTLSNHNFSQQFSSPFVNLATFALPWCHVTVSLVFALSCALFPGAPWNGLYLFYKFTLHSLVNVHASQISSLLISVSLRLTILIYNYLTLRIITNFATINILLNLLNPMFLLSCAMSFCER